MSRADSTIGARLRAVHDRLYERYGERGCPLHHESPYQLLVAVILSAQCRDDRVNAVTPELFRRYPDPAAMAAADPAAVAELIRPCGLYQAKAGYLVDGARELEAHFGGELPRSMDELVRLPGVGRKSANVVLGNAFGIPGFPVDTHVNRVLNRLGLAGSRDPETIEARINAEVPPELWTNFSHLLITHGRETCHARRPACATCILAEFCPQFGIKGAE